MSYDVWLEADCGGDERMVLSGLGANYTYNVAPMFYGAIGESPNAWDNSPASDVLAKCVAIITAFSADPQKYRAMNPANGWGDFEGAFRFIWNVGCACARAPAAFVRVC